MSVTNMTSSTTAPARPAPRRVRALAGALITAGTVITLAGTAAAAGSAPAYASAKTPASTATPATKIVCVKRTAVKPPPKGVLKARPVVGAGSSPEASPASVRVKAVCPSGKVPSLRPFVRHLPKGNPDRPGRIRAGSAGQSSMRPAAACDGVVYQSSPSWCYYYAGASYLWQDQGGGHTLQIENPKVVGAGHSLEELSVQGGTGDGNIVELGSVVYGGTNFPQMFVFHWNNWNPSCYNCDFVQYSGTYFPGMNLSPFVGKQVYNGYVYYQGNWWAWFNDQWVGYFPGSLWSGKYAASNLTQWFGEVATQNGVPPQTQMGNGLFASNPGAAHMSTLCNVDAAAWVCFYYDKQTLYQTDPAYYTVLHTGFGSIRLGGPGT
jgi:Neprosin